MRKTFRASIGVAVVAWMAAAPSVASAAVSPQEATCVGVIEKNIAKYQATLARNLAGCHKSRSHGKIASSTNCNTATDADLKGRRFTTRAAIQTKIVDGCNPAGIGLANSQFPRCPSPVATSDDAVTAGIDSYAELANCLMDLSEAYVNRIGETALGNPTMSASLDGTIADAVNNKGLLKCQGTIGKGIAKAIKTASATRGKCQVAKIKTLPASLDYDSTVGGCGGTAGDPSSKIAHAMSAINDGIAAACSETALDESAAASKSNLDTLGACGDSVSELQGCITERAVRRTANGLAAAMFEFPNDGAGNLNCAGSADITLNAGYGRKFTNSRLDWGFSGYAHGVDVADEAQVGVLLSGCNADCENCDITIDTDQGSCRCGGALAYIECSTINGSDPACGGGTCHCMFGPPLALSSGGTPVCVVNRFASDFSGGTSVVGEYDVNTRTRALVHLGLDMIRPCPTCESGTCNGGTRNGSSCTIDATHPDFGATSFDCPPSAAANVTGTGLNLALRFTSGTVGFTAAIPTGANCALGTCHCSQCSGNGLVGCASTADCTAVGAGTCGQNLGADNPKQNGCSAGVADCVVDPATPGMGICATGTLQFCDGEVRQNGKGIVPCNVNADCAALGPNYGACTLLENQSCFLPAISATGTPGIFNSEGVSTFCSAQTSNSGVNQAFGLPGPGRVKLDFDFDVRCFSGGAAYELPGGSNCP